MLIKFCMQMHSLLTFFENEKQVLFTFYLKFNLTCEKMSYWSQTMLSRCVFFLSLPLFISFNTLNTVSEKHPTNILLQHAYTFIAENWACVFMTIGWKYRLWSKSSIKLTLPMFWEQRHVIHHSSRFRRRTKLFSLF